MRTKVLSVIVIVCLFLTLMGVGMTILPRGSELCGFLDYFALFIVASYLWCGTVLGCVGVIRWFCK